MAARTVSVVIVSRGRPDALGRCLAGVAQLDHPAFEIVTVACPGGIAAVERHPAADRIKRVPFDRPNIAEARNLGIAYAAGEIVAFIDDDAVPEPTWLHRLASAFDDPAVAAAGGYVRGRNGISFQWRAQSIDTSGASHELGVAGDDPVLPQPPDGHAVKTQGTNMAFRRAVLTRLGGFDPAFRFFLEDSDLNLRLAAAGHRTAIVPLAEVHHGYAASPRRAADRTPRDLTEIGASMAVFLRKHCPTAAQDAAWRAFRDSQRQRLLRYMQRGPMGPDDVVRLLRGLEAGYRDGLTRGISIPATLGTVSEPFQPFPGRPAAMRAVFSARSWQRSRRMNAAARAVADGQIATLVTLSPTALFHHVRFHQNGVWEQRGGLFGRSRRDAPLFQLWRFSRRVAAELDRIREQRGLSPRT